MTFVPLEISEKTQPNLQGDEPLPQTFRFVIALGVFILIGWFLMFALLQARW